MAEIVCSLCLIADGVIRSDVVTVINGQAVCPEHAGYVQGSGFTVALATLAEHTRERGT